MKYWIANIEERNGEFEYEQPIIFTAETKAKANEIHEFHVSTWYGPSMRWDEDDKCYWYEHVTITEGTMTEIDEHTFEQMRKHGDMSDMTRMER